MISFLIHPSHLPSPLSPSFFIFSSFLHFSSTSFHPSSTSFHLLSPFFLSVRPSLASFSSPSSHSYRSSSSSLSVLPRTTITHERKIGHTDGRLRAGTNKNHPIVNRDLGEKILCSLTCVLHSLAIVLPRENGLKKIKQ